MCGIVGYVGRDRRAVEVLIDGLRRLETGGLILGLFPHAAYDEETLELQPGDVVVIFSDGVSEAPNSACVSP